MSEFDDLLNDASSNISNISADVNADMAHAARVRIVAPSTAVDQFNYMGATGNLDV